MNMECCIARYTAAGGLGDKVGSMLAQKNIDFKLEPTRIFVKKTSAGQCCPTTEVINGDISNGLYRAADNILSDGIAVPGGETEFKAGQLIKLSPDFKIPTGGGFKANIENCIN